ncbi:MAG: hypothetical protein Q4B94_10945 [Pseudomonadota bacterium]|nr:hypothetical protein [Pseudomonadota bacterium]
MDIAVSSQQYISYPARVKINQIEPRLDIFWRDELRQIFATLPDTQKEKIADTLLASKEVHWDKASDTFHFTGKPVDFKNHAGSIAIPGLKQLAQWLQACLEKLAEYRQPMQIADLLENSLGKINSFHAGDNIEVQAEKQQLHKIFIYAAAEIIASKEQWNIPKNYRNLSSQVIKTYINEVFLKQQLLDYWFRTLRSRQLASYPQPLINTWLRQEQRIRQLEIVKSSRYLFAIAPSVEKDINIFSIRRFMNEEQLLAGGKIYFNCAVIDMRYCEDAQHAERFQQQVEQIVTLEGRVSKAIIDLAIKMEENHDKHILPALFSPLDAAETSLEKAISKHLLQYEKLLSSLVLDLLIRGLTQIASHHDECEYLYVTTRQLWSGIIGSFQDFQLQPAVLGDIDCERMMTRLVGYVALLKKRRDETFVLKEAQDWKIHRVLGS